MSISFNKRLNCQQEQTMIPLVDPIMGDTVSHGPLQVDLKKFFTCVFFSLVPGAPQEWKQRLRCLGRQFPTISDAIFEQKFSGIICTNWWWYSAYPSHKLSYHVKLAAPQLTKDLNPPGNAPTNCNSRLMPHSYSTLIQKRYIDIIDISRIKRHTDAVDIDFRSYRCTDNTDI